MNERPTQEKKVLEVLIARAPEWVNGNAVFLREMGLTQYHRAIWNLQHHKERYAYKGTIEASTFTDDYGFKSYRIVGEWLDDPAPKTVNEGIPYQDRLVDNSAPADDELIPGLRFVQGPLL